MTLEHQHDDHGQEHDHGDHDHDHGDRDHDAHEHVAYPEAVARFRADKDEYFRGAHDSPIPHERRHDFPGLPYFPVDESLRFDGLKLEPYAGTEPASFQIPTSDGQLRPAIRAGVFRFDAGGTTQALTGYTFESGASESAVVPFLDLASRHETDGARRYLDLFPEADW